MRLETGKKVAEIGNIVAGVETEAEKRGYDKGLIDAWAAAAVAADLSDEDFAALFGREVGFYDLLKEYDPADVIERLGHGIEYKAGDEVIYTDGTKAILMDIINEDGDVYVYNENGCVDKTHIDCFAGKTGRFARLTDLLKKMQKQS